MPASSVFFTFVISVHDPFYGKTRIIRVRYPGPRICRTFAQNCAAVSSQGLPEIADPLGCRPKAGRAAGSFARRSAKADNAARTSPRRSAKADCAARTSPRRSAKADHPAWTSSRQSAKADHPARTSSWRSAKADRAARTSSRRSAKADCAARTSSRRSAKADCAARTSSRRSGKADRAARTSSRRSAKADHAARTSSRRSAKADNGGRLCPDGAFSAARPAGTARFLITRGKASFYETATFGRRKVFFCSPFCGLLFCPTRAKLALPAGEKPAAPKPRPPRGGPPNDRDRLPVFAPPARTPAPATPPQSACSRRLSGCPKRPNLSARRRAESPKGKGKRKGGTPDETRTAALTTTPPEDGWEGSQPKRPQRRGKPAKQPRRSAS